MALTASLPVSETLTPAPGLPADLRVSGPAIATRSALHVVNGEHYSGAERVQDLLALELPAFGFEVGFACLKQGLFAEKRVAQSSPVYDLSMRGKFDLRPAREVARIACEGDYSLLHAHTPRSLLVAALAAMQTGLPLVYHVHSPASRDSTRQVANWLNDRVERWAARVASQLLTVSPTLTDHMRTMGFSPDVLRCVLNGVPSLPPEAAGARRRKQPIGPFVVGMVALFRPRKGAEVLLDAIAELRERGHDVRLQAIGPFETDEYREELYQREAGLALQEVVHWTGFTDDVPAELAKIDALALPSLFGEGLPMVVLEAMAAGLPVVATRCEGTTEAVLDGETGFVVEAASVVQMADALEKLIAGEVDYAEMSLAARRRHADRFSSRSMARQVASVYEGVLRGASPDPSGQSERLRKVVSRTR
jgi:glycosyltransferase involved in cell wall biosynthesis